MRAMFRGFEEVLWDRLQKSKNIDAFCVEVKSVMECILHAQSKPVLSPSQLYTQIDEMGWENIAYISDDFSKLWLRVIDSADRMHTLRLSFSPDFPLSQPSITADLPSSWSVEWTSRAGLRDALSQFQLAVDSYQDFWNVMDDIVKRAWVHEPVQLSRADISRRIYLGGHCSVSIKINPATPRSLPECTFFGPGTVVSPLRQRLIGSSMIWTEDKNLLDNLETVLQVPIPPPPETHQLGGLSTECGICYAYKLPDEDGIPDHVCNNPSCGQAFHTICLADWLPLLPTTIQSFNVLHGTCPYCSHTLAVNSVH
ncbi:E3 ubiquitin-protein ligase FANCL-like [Selaginella moellendorffii]|uniref:E3 ubiquitin-protein ligase FANCL-like n=1 Tax=Selaginella moellendorffii TaxID=88036 RepID=UPI000D1C817F|nr:E3 ubiquitin-protein ligase FANCL-like [Selaginella moellendorffii]|eukprot:XP_024533515.1 E3 ubiquitin-protein ligase FANCL-like [Selaginella moellendorffii]